MSSDYKYCLGLKVEATVELGHRVKSQCFRHLENIQVLTHYLDTSFFITLQDIFTLSPYFQQIFRSVFTNYTTEMKQSNAYWLSVYQLCSVSYLTFVLSKTRETFTSPASAMLSGKDTFLIRRCSPNTEIRAARFQSIRDLEAKWPTVQE